LAQWERLRDCEAKYFSGKDLYMGLFRCWPDRPREVLALVGLHPWLVGNPDGFELGYWTATPHAGRGYATLAAQCATLYALDKLAATRVQVVSDEANGASRRVIEKCGFHFEGALEGFLPSATEAQRAAGLRVTGRGMLSALTAPTFYALPWVPTLRASLRYFNAWGHAEPQ
jgi:RimJ/RimL family protein N-acetyltransferase